MLDQNMEQEEILIIGGSMAGLLVAMSLKNRGYKIKFLSVALHRLKIGVLE